jgi:hypothetical protein
MPDGLRQGAHRVPGGLDGQDAGWRRSRGASTDRQCRRAAIDTRAIVRPVDARPERSPPPVLPPGLRLCSRAAQWSLDRERVNTVFVRVSGRAAVGGKQDRRRRRRRQARSRRDPSLHAQRVLTISGQRVVGGKSKAAQADRSRGAQRPIPVRLMIALHRGRQRSYGGGSRR